MKWISVKNELPYSEDSETPLDDMGGFDSEEYLIYNKLYGISIARYMDDGWWRNFQCKVSGGEVTHWMPLPKKPFK